MIGFSAPLAGLMAAESSLNRAAAQIANSGFARGDSVELSAETIALIEARNDGAASARVVRTENQMTRSLLNMVG